MNLAFLPDLAGPDGILILLIVLLLFGAKNTPAPPKPWTRRFEDEDE